MDEVSQSSSRYRQSNGRGERNKLRPGTVGVLACCVPAKLVGYIAGESRHVGDCGPQDKAIHVFKSDLSANAFRLHAEPRVWTRPSR